MHEYQSPEDMTWWFWPKAHPGVFLTESMPTVSNEHIVGRTQTLRTAVQSCVNSGPSLPKARHKPERRGGGKTGMIECKRQEQQGGTEEQQEDKTMGDVTLKGYDMTNTVTKGTGVRVHKQ